MSGQEPLSYGGASKQEQALGIAGGSVQYVQKPSMQKGHTEGHKTKEVSGEIAKMHDAVKVTKVAPGKVQLED